MVPGRLLWQHCRVGENMESQTKTLTLQARFNEAMSAVRPEPKSPREMPIYRRPQNDLVERALSNAVNALSTLWKVRPPNRPLRCTE
jgi:hypothetical protein